MTGLDAKNLSFSYNDKPVISGVSFAAAAGETWAVIGRNGAGKSTLLKCLCGLLRYNQGTVSINNTPINKLTPREIALQIAYVPQGANRPVPPFTVREYVLMARYPYSKMGAISTRKDKDAADEALELTDTVHLAGRMMNTLSGGEFQTVLIAGAAAQETPFLLLDEPTTHLDPRHQEDIRRMTARVHERRGAAVITITHDVNFALSTHNNILALIDGRVFFRGTRDEFCAGAVSNLEKIFSVDFRAVDCPGQTTIFAVNHEPCTGGRHRPPAAPDGAPPKITTGASL
ncbi:MAG: ABC transporter ATP-binding protein [Chitinispirillia bacterium]|nr:ABC transporter ATP-binding protein [Chitinispirillia bacterium]MCL2268006.1 ABC transporter ATP-binding protein [Chitinispirillia bacterium]